MAETKPAQLRIRIADEDMPVIEDLKGKVLSVTDVASMLLSAAVEAVKANGGRVNFPPKFEVSHHADGTAALYDKPPRKR